MKIVFCLLPMFINCSIVGLDSDRLGAPDRNYKLGELIIFVLLLGEQVA